MPVLNSEDSDSTFKDDVDNDDVMYNDQGAKDFHSYFDNDSLQGFLGLAPLSVLDESDFYDHDNHHVFFLVLYVWILLLCFMY